MSIPEYNIDWSRYMEGLDGKADRDLGNLNIVTNCITEIPQNIKLELKDNNIIVKAGTKFTFADGRVLTVDSDKIFPNGVPATLKDLIMVWDNNHIGIYIQGANATSGTTPPAKIPDTKDYIWFDTNENKMKVTHDTQASWYEIPLPIGTCDIEPNKYVSINQVFNGFGYIGSAVFALSGVKGLSPKTKTNKGELLNKEFLTNKLFLTECSSAKNSNITVIIGDVFRFWYDSDIYIGIKQPSGSWNYWYDTLNNVHKFCEEDGVYKEEYTTPCINVSTDEKGNVKIFKPKQPFHALDYNDKSVITGWGSPDYSRTINLPDINPTNTSPVFYTAPTDGIFYFSARRTTAGFTLRVYLSGTLCFRVPADNPIAFGSPLILSKGNTVQFITDTPNISWNVWQNEFIPLKGAN